MKPRRRTPLIERIARRVQQQGDCWIWAGYRDRQGYGQISRGGREGSALAHRMAYESYIGPIPDGLVLDHLCLTPSCVNPWHLDPVPHEVNVARAAELINQCKSGHEFTEANTYMTPRGSRQCRACNREAAARCKARKAVQP